MKKIIEPARTVSLVPAPVQIYSLLHARRHPHYHEVFLDEGDVDMVRALNIYQKNGYDDVMIPDHTPHMTCSASWHVGMAYALGYMRGIIATISSK